MKIGLVCPYDFTWPGGVLAHVSQLSRQFTLLGHEVKILAPYTPGREQAGEGDYIPIGRSVPVPYGGSLARISLSVGSYKQVRQVLDREQFDIVHTHEPLAPVLPLYAVQYSQATNVGTFHACYSSARRYRLTHRLLRPWFDRLHGCIAVSPGAYENARTYFDRDFRIIPNGIDLERFSDVQPFPHLDDGKFNLLFVGRMEARKGLRYLLEAYAQLKWDYPQLRLIVVGPGNLDADCWRVMSERNLQDVVFTGSVPMADIPRYYASCHVFCAPATGQESFGIVLLEAMASCKPIVAARNRGYSAVVRHRHQALMAPTKDSEALAEAIRELIEDPDLREQLAFNGREDVQRYDWSVVADEVMDYYQSLLGRSAAGGNSQGKSNGVA